MSFSAGLALFFVVLVGGLVGFFVWMGILERKEDRERARLLRAVGDAERDHHGEQVASARAELAKLSPEEIRSGLRLRVGPATERGEGLVHCARRITPSIDCRLSMEGMKLRGLEREARARLSEDDGALVALATSQTLGTRPTTPGRAPVAWLAAPEALLTSDPAVLAVMGSDVHWIPPPARAEALVEFAAEAAAKPGPLRRSLFFWDGATLVDIGSFTPTLSGPTTPDVILRLPQALCDLTGMPAQVSFRFGGAIRMSILANALSVKPIHDRFNAAEIEQLEARLGCPIPIGLDEAHEYFRDVDETTLDEFVSRLAPHHRGCEVFLPVRFEQPLGPRGLIGSVPQLSADLARLGVELDGQRSPDSAASALKAQRRMWKLWTHAAEDALESGRILELVRL